MSLGALRGLAAIGVMDAIGGGSSLKAQPPAGARAAGHGAASARGQIRFPALTVDILPLSVGLPPGSPAGRAADASYQPEAAARSSSGSADLSSDSAGDWLSLSDAASDPTESALADEWQPAKPPGGGAAMAPRGGSGALATGRGSIQPLRVPPPTQNAGSASPAASAAASSALLSALGLGARVRRQARLLRPARGRPSPATPLPLLSVAAQPPRAPARPRREQGLPLRAVVRHIPPAPSRPWSAQHLSWRRSITTTAR